MVESEPIDNKKRGQPLVLREGAGHKQAQKPRSQHLHAPYARLFLKSSPSAARAESGRDSATVAWWAAGDGVRVGVLGGRGGGESAGPAFRLGVLSCLRSRKTRSFRAASNRQTVHCAALTYVDRAARGEFAATRSGNVHSQQGSGIGWWSAQQRQAGQVHQRGTWSGDSLPGPAPPAAASRGLTYGRGTQVPRCQQGGRCRSRRRRRRRGNSSSNNTSNSWGIVVLTANVAGAL